MNNFTKLYSDHCKYLKLKEQNQTLLTKIDQAISGEMIETPEQIKDRIEGIKLRIKEKKEILA